MTKDIETSEDIRLLVDNFYNKVLQNEVIGHFFTKVVKLDLDKHMPVMYNFWETTLLGNITYKGNPMSKHIALNQKQQITQEHFAEWLRLWNETINEHFSGKKAQEAKQRAESIASLMIFKIGDQ